MLVSSPKYLIFNSSFLLIPWSCVCRTFQSTFYTCSEITTLEYSERLWYIIVNQRKGYMRKQMVTLTYVKFSLNILLIINSSKLLICRILQLFVFGEVLDSWRKMKGICMSNQSVFLRKDVHCEFVSLIVFTRILDLHAIKTNLFKTRFILLYLK